jgi:hypothetical protein
VYAVVGSRAPLASYTCTASLVELNPCCAAVIVSEDVVELIGCV